MNKLFCLTILLVAYAPLSALASCSALQELAWVVQDMDSTELGPNGQYKCIPITYIENGRQYVSFTTTIDENPDDVFKTIVGYMANAVGTATASYVTCGKNKFTITFEGDYDCNLQRPSRLQSLARVLRDYKEPSLANRKCSQYCYELDDGFAYVSITIPLTDGSSYETACNDVYDYLSSLHKLDQTVITKKFSYNSDCNSGFLEIWSN